MAAIERFSTPDVYESPAYAQGVKVTDARTMIFLSGQVAYDKDGSVLDHRRRTRRHEPHEPDLHRARGELQRESRPHRGRPRQERRALAAAEGVHTPLLVSVWLLHVRLPERVPGAAGAPRQDARRAR